MPQADERVQVPENAAPPAAATPSAGATARTMRLSNRALLLNLIREHAPVSRPSLALLSGMHRSNVALIAETLLAEGLVQEVSGEAQGRGRIASVLSLANSRPAVLGISVRPARTTGLLATLDGSTETLFEFPTPAAPEEFLLRLREHCAGAGRGRQRELKHIRQVVVAVPGRMLPKAGLWMPDFPLYGHFPLVEQVRSLLGKPVTLANGGNVAALAAARTEHGGAPASNLAFVAVHDEGVGGGIVERGRLLAGFDGSFAGEFGHMIVASDGPRCACGSRGCWGELVSNRAVWAKLAPGRELDSGLYREALKAAVVSGRGRSRRVVEEAVETLLRGLRNIAVTLNPAEIIVAGDLTLLWPLVRERLERCEIFPNFMGTIHPASRPLAELYQLGTVQHALAQIFRPDASFSEPASG